MGSSCSSTCWAEWTTLLPAGLGGPINDVGMLQADERRMLVVGDGGFIARDSASGWIEIEPGTTSDLLALSVDDEHITDIQADGIIFSTPAGSTAYNMSAGGAIVAPGVPGLSLTAICPYSYFNSIVVPPESTVTIELLKPRSDAVAIVDGRRYIPLKPLSVIEATVSENRANFIRFKPFYTRIRRRIFHLRTE